MAPTNHRLLTEGEPIAPGDLVATPTHGWLPINPVPADPYHPDDFYPIARPLAEETL